MPKKARRGTAPKTGAQGFRNGKKHMRPQEHEDVLGKQPWHASVQKYTEEQITPGKRFFEPTALTESEVLKIQVGPPRRPGSKVSKGDMLIKNKDPLPRFAFEQQARRQVADKVVADGGSVLMDPDGTMRIKRPGSNKYVPVTVEITNDMGKVVQTIPPKGSYDEVTLRAAEAMRENHGWLIDSMIERQFRIVQLATPEKCYDGMQDVIDHLDWTAVFDTMTPEDYAVLSKPGVIRRVLAGAAGVAIRGELYALTDEIMERHIIPGMMGLEGNEVFTVDLLPQRDALILFEQAVALPGHKGGMIGIGWASSTPEDGRAPIMLFGIGARVEQDGYGILPLMLLADRKVPIPMGYLNSEDNHHGHTHDVDYIGEINAWGLFLRPFIMCLLYFINQNYLTASRGRASRGVRKRLEREAPTMPEQLVRVIHLRKRVHKYTGSEEGEHREYNCQWFVKGHWRKQWYAKAQVHQKIWITAYIKGPEDKPLKPPATRVFSVDR